MSHVADGVARSAPREIPTELVALMDRVRALPSEVREELVPVVEEALEQAVYRSRVLTIARDALERFRLDLEMTKFDLEATRREKERLRRLIDDSWE